MRDRCRMLSGLDRRILLPFFAVCRECWQIPEVICCGILHRMKVTDSVKPSAKSLSPIQSKAFRHDINGLRVWAVVAVVLYHFGVPSFVGVDVFLMTRIIISGPCTQISWLIF